MEQWEALLEACPTPPDLRYFSKAVQIAGVVLKEDLAPFEIDWILQTLLYKPVNLISVVTSKRTEDLWAKPLGDSFKLLTEIAETHTEAAEKHFNAIVTVCLLPFAPLTRKMALCCLTQISKLSELAARDVHRHVGCLEETTTCRAPLAVLIGTICEHHPVTVANDFNKIWRIFLNLLDSNKYTDTVTQSLLQGVLGLLKHFGCDLPTAELTTFYDKIVNSFRIPICHDICLRIFIEHSNLFRERLSKDVRLRNGLWNALHDNKNANSATAAIISVYKAICGPLSKEEMQKIVTTELLPQIESYRSAVKYTALRTLSHIKTVCGINIEMTEQTDAHTLQFELTNDKLSYDSAEAVLYCIELNQPNSDKLLQTAILFYTNLPSSRRKEIVVHGLLNGAPELRTAATNFLISESTMSLENLDRIFPLWRDIFDTNNNKDIVVMEKSRYIFEDFMNYVSFVLDAFMEGEQTVKERHATLLNLTAHILTLQPPEVYTKDHCTVLLPMLIGIFEMNNDSFTMAALRCVCVHLQDDLDDVMEFYKTIRIDRCKDEALLCESCLTLIDAPNGAIDVANLLMALQIMFSRNDVEPKSLTTALKKLEFLIVNDKANLDENCLNQIIQQIEKLRSRKDLKGKDARILHRDVVMFLGKYGNSIDKKNDVKGDDVIITKLMDTLTLNIPNPNEGTNYKINLQSILQLALELEDSDALHMLLIIICANLQTKKTSELELCLTRVCYGLSRALARGHTVDVSVLSAATSVHGLLEYISDEKSPGVRKMLSDSLEELLVKKNDDELVSAVAERACVMMINTESTTRRAGLNITEILMTVLKNNNLLTKSLLPNIIVIISKTKEIDSADVLDISTKHFIGKIELFENSTIEELIRKLIKVLINNNENFEITITSKCSNFEVGSKLSIDEVNRTQKSNMASAEMKIYKNTTKMILEFIKNIFEYKNDDVLKVLQIFLNVFEKENGDFVKSLYVLAEMRRIFDFNTDFCRNVLSYNQCLILNKILCMEITRDDYFCMEMVMRFLEEYSEILLEIQYQKTVEFIVKVIKNLTPDCIKKIPKCVQNCLSKYVKTSTPNKLRNAFENWCDDLQLNIITTSIEKELFTYEHSVKVFALKIMLEMLNLTDLSTLTEVKNSVKNWAKILLNLFSRDYITNYLKSKMSYLIDILTVSVKFLTITEVKMLLLEGSGLIGLPTENIGVKFATLFIDVFCDLLIIKPYILLDNDMNVCSVLINEIVKYTLKKKRREEEYEKVLGLVNELWPIYEDHSTFNKKHSLLLDLNIFPKKLESDSNPMRWAKKVIELEGTREEQARIIAVLPGGQDYCATYRLFAVSLPVRLSELRGGAHASLRALLDALVNTGDVNVLDIVCSLAAADEAKGWWDEAIDSCMASVAVRADLPVYKAVYTRCWEGLSLGVCRRVLLPLLRYSSSAFCEEFFSTILKDLLTVKEIRVASNHYAYHKSIVDYCRVLTLLQVAFEKISPASLESPSSRLYAACPATQSWHVVTVACKICVTLRCKVKLPPEPSDGLIRDYRTFVSVNYSCLSAALCRRRPDARFYDCVFDVQVWDSLIDADVEYDLKIRTHWNQRTKRKPVSIDVETRDVSHTSTVRTAGTVRTKMFLRTLSENPLMYDLIEDSRVEEIKTQDLQLIENELNNHDSAATLTALFCHASTLTSDRWRGRLVEGLRGGWKNTRWLLAQVVVPREDPTGEPPYVYFCREAAVSHCCVSAGGQESQSDYWHRRHTNSGLRIVCNCKEELKPHASALRPGLLEIVASTAIERNGKRLLNGLHIDIIETLIHWGDTEPLTFEPLTATLGLLLTTCLYFRKHKSIFNTLLDVLGKFLDLYSSVVNINWNIFQGSLDDTEASNTIQILQRVSKHKINIPELLPTLLDKFENKQYCQLTKFAELLGLALGACEEKQGFLFRFKKALNQLSKTNAGEYVKMLYYAQDGCPDCCDDYNFRQIMNLTPKIVGPEKNKCLKILTAYTVHFQNDCTKDMFETIDLADLITVDTINVLNLVKEGIGVMGEMVKRKLVAVSMEYCTHPIDKIRRSACEVALAAFEDLCTGSMEPPLPKKATTTNTEIMKHINSKDIYVITILNAISIGAIDRDASISLLVRQGVANFLNKDNMGVRFTECFLLCVHLPLTSNNKTQDLSVCVSALLDMLFSDLKSQERFKKIKLRDEPLEFRESNIGPSKLLTMSRTYQGTFRNYSNLTSRRRTTPVQDQNTSAINVQISLETILDTFLRFSKDNLRTSQELCLQFVKALPGFEPTSILTTALCTILAGEPNDLTPFIVDVTRIFIDEMCHVNGLLETAEKFKKSTLNSEGRRLANLLHNEIRLRTLGAQQFVLGTVIDDNQHDALPMIKEPTNRFSLQDLTSAFGKLSNWDALTRQEQRKTISSGLPALWEDKDSFTRVLRIFMTCDSYSQESSSNWFDKMISAYKQEDRECTMKWLRSLDKWPRRHFEMSAITEAIEWLSGQKDQQITVCDIQPSDCLVEWAARLMIRSAHMNSLTGNKPKESDIILSRSHELVWCERAIETGIWSPVLNCVKRNTTLDLFESETLPFLYKKILVLRNIEVKKMNTGPADNLFNHEESLSRLINTIEKYLPDLADKSDDVDVISMNRLIIMINTDLKHYMPDKIRDSMEILNEHLKERRNYSKNRNALHAFYETAVLSLDKDWDNIEESNPELIWSVAVDILKKLQDTNIKDIGIACTIINKLDIQNGGYCLNEDTARLFLDLIKKNYQDDFVLELLDAFRNRFPSHLLNEYAFMSERDDDIRTKYKRCLQLVCDAEYSLLQYCGLMLNALRDNDKDIYMEVFNRMKNRIFENPYAGSDYQILNKYRTKLYEIQLINNDFSDTFKTNSKTALKIIIQELQRKVPQNVLRLSQLCPELSHLRGSPGNLLGLPDNVTVVRFDEQIPVFTDSIRRPTIIKVLLSNGKTRRYLHKNGESMANDAAAQNVSRYAETLWAKVRCPLMGYNVTRLSDDSGLIEYLEDHERLRDLVAENCDLNAPLTAVRRPADHELLTTSILSNLSQFDQLSSFVPSRALRDAVLKRSITQNDFLIKQKMFQDTVASSTIITWILNLGDRHLQNILYSKQNGGVCHVDWGAVFQWQHSEYVPARLTRNILAVCDVQELEARLQQLLSILRNSRQTFIQVIDLYFKRLRTQYDKSVVDHILQGKINYHSLPSREITKFSIHEHTQIDKLTKSSEQNMRSKLFPTIDDQITALLNRCTNPILLSITRSGWEPWV